MENPSNLEYLFLIILSIICGLGVRTSLEFANQRWAMTYHHTMSYALLPPVTMVITTLIAGNIALSLGMIGALSIVRFRHPVKSALELIMYFDLITIGIATSVRTKWAIQLLLASVAIIFLVKLVQKISSKFGKSFYNMSFNEGNTTNTLEIFSKEKIDFVEKSEYLANFLSDNATKEFVYRMNFNNKKELQDFKKKLEEQKNIDKINVIYN